MPKKANDKLIENTNLDTKNTSKKSTTKNVSKTAKSATTVAKKSEKKAATSKKTEKKATTTKSSSKAKVASTSAVKKSSKKSSSTQSVKNSAVANSKTVKKSSARAKSGTKKKQISEYYDLPNSYNQTIVKILAQTPTILFVYWDLSVEDSQNFISTYGDDFFNNTIPYLVVKNETKDYSFEVEINDYANSWYINIPDSDCKYDVTLIRKAKNDNINLENNFITITSSNNLQTPNDHILFENLSKNIFFINV